MKFKRLILGLGLLIPAFSAIHGKEGSGSEAASFLNIPVGAEPAGLGGAYSSMATNAYAPVWNAGGLGFAEGTQLAAQHLAYLQSINYEFVGFSKQLERGGSFGASVQYLGTGDIAASDVSGNSIGSISSRYSAYSVSYGKPLTPRFALGATGKIIDARLADVGATAYAFDAGAMFKMSDRLTLSAVAANMGSPLKFISSNDPLPLAFHAGGAYRPSDRWTLALEGVYRQTGLTSAHAGVEFMAARELTLRAGYRTDTLKGQSPIAGLTVGIGLNLLGQTLSYAWLPVDELGNTHYISLLIRFNKAEN